jgi:hypothetical protein
LVQEVCLALEQVAVETQFVVGEQLATVVVEQEELEEVLQAP